MFYDVPCEAPECPVSYITADSQELVNVILEAQTCHDAGAALFGPDLSKWDARIVDAQVVIETCRAERRAAEHAKIYGK